MLPHAGWRCGRLLPWLPRSSLPAALPPAFRSCAVYCACSAVIGCVRLLSRLVLGEQSQPVASSGAALQPELPAVPTKTARKNGADSVSSSGGIAAVKVDGGGVIRASSAALPTPSAAMPLPAHAAHAGERQDEQQRDGGAAERRAAPSGRLLQRLKKGLRGKPRA